MSELKVHNFNDFSLHDMVNCKFYLKSEADKCIAHNKFKRCLDKADLCESKEKRLEAIAPLFDTDKECWEYGSDYWKKWHKQWLQLAEQFKETDK